MYINAADAIINTANKKAVVKELSGDHPACALLEILAAIAFDGKVCGGAGDKGVDVRCPDRIIQCKLGDSYKGGTAPIVRELIGTCVLEGVKTGVLVMSAFTDQEDVLKVAAERGCTINMMNVTDLRTKIQEKLKRMLDACTDNDDALLCALQVEVKLMLSNLKLATKNAYGSFKLSPRRHTGILELALHLCALSRLSLTFLFGSCTPSYPTPLFVAGKNRKRNAQKGSSMATSQT